MLDSLCQFNSMIFSIPSKTASLPSSVVAHPAPLHRPKYKMISISISFTRYLRVFRLSCLVTARNEAFA